MSTEARQWLGVGVFVGTLAVCGAMQALGLPVWAETGVALVGGLNAGGLMFGHKIEGP